MRKRFIAVLLAFVASIGLVMVTAGPASAATTGGDVDHLSGSRGSIVIWQHNGFSRYLYPGQSSYDYPGYHNDVQSFRPQSGTVCRSQYSGTQYPYKGGVRYYMSHDNINLVMWCKVG